MDHTPLDIGALSAAAQKALRPGPGRMMASRGMLPLTPADQLAVLYQLAIDGDSALAQTARATAADLPDKVLVGALGDAATDPRVLDLFAQLCGDKPGAFEALVGNAAIADSSIAALATRATAKEIERISANEQRLLRYPEIIAAMYLNKQARMSTVDRAVELAVRNNVRVPGLAAWDEVARALQGAPATTPEIDAQFAAAAAAASGDDSALTKGDAEQALPEDASDADVEDAAKMPYETLSLPAKIRLATLGNAFARSRAIRDPHKIVSLAAIKSPGVTEIEAARYAGNATLNEDVIRYIAQRREWTKLYAVKVSLCRNPKTSIPEAARLLPFLRQNDLQNLARSKGVASALVAQARKLMMNRSGGGAKK